MVIINVGIEIIFSRGLKKDFYIITNKGNILLQIGTAVLYKLG